MITEDEARARAEYMHLVHRQLTVLRGRRDLAADDYGPLLELSSLRLSEMEWVRAMIEEGARAGKVASVLDRLVMYYEGYFEALARVLDSRPDDLIATWDAAKRQRIEGEMMQVPTRGIRRPTKG